MSSAMSFRRKGCRGWAARQLKGERSQLYRQRGSMRSEKAFGRRAVLLERGVRKGQRHMPEPQRSPAAERTCHDRMLEYKGRNDDYADLTGDPVASRSFPRDEIPHDPADNGDPQDDADGNGKDDGKEKGQLEDHIKEREQQRAEDESRASGRKILRLQHSGSRPFPLPEGPVRRVVRSLNDDRTQGTDHPPAVGNGGSDARL